MSDIEVYKTPESAIEVKEEVGDYRAGLLQVSFFWIYAAIFLLKSILFTAGSIKKNFSLAFCFDAFCDIVLYGYLILAWSWHVYNNYDIKKKWVNIIPYIVVVSAILSYVTNIVLQVSRKGNPNPKEMAEIFMNAIISESILLLLCLPVFYYSLKYCRRHKKMFKAKL